MLAEQGAIQSTRGAALEYAPPMRSTSLLVPAFLLLVGACQDPEPENLPGEFGEPCVPGALADTPDGCVSGTKCYQGYCEEVCADDGDCQEVVGWQHTCIAGLCQILCDDEGTCPQDLGTAMNCGLVGSTPTCEAADSA